VAKATIAAARIISSPWSLTQPAELLVQDMSKARTDSHLGVARGVRPHSHGG